jgi:hypothetical protein
MKEKRLGELSETQLENMMDAVLDETFDQMPADEFFGTLKAMDDADTPERIVIKGHVENGEFVPHHADGASIEGKSIRVNRKAIIEIRIEAA